MGGVVHDLDHVAHVVAVGPVPRWRPVAVTAARIAKTSIAATTASVQRVEGPPALTTGRGRSDAALGPRR